MSLSVSLFIKYEIFKKPNGKLHGFVHYYINNKLMRIEGLYDDGKDIEINMSFGEE